MVERRVIIKVDCSFDAHAYLSERNHEIGDEDKSERLKVHG